MPGIEIDIPAVVAIGAKVGQVAARMDDEAAAIDGWAYQGQWAVPDSNLCRGTMINAADHWAVAIRDVAAAVRQYGADLTTTAETYAAYDRMSAQELRQFDDPSAGGPYR